MGVFSIGVDAVENTFGSIYSCEVADCGSGAICRVSPVIIGCRYWPDLYGL